METLNICVSSFSLRHGGGADLAAWGQAVELSKYHNVVVLTNDSVVTSTGDLIESENGVGIERYHIKPRTLLKVAKQLRGRFDLISSHTVPMDMLAVLSGTPHVLHDYGLPSLRVSTLYDSLKYWLSVNGFRVFTANHPETRLILPSSSYIAHDLRWISRHSKSSFILHSGIDFPAPDTVGPSPLPFKYVLFVGRHVRYKQVDRLIRLFERAKKRLGSDVHLVTVGLRYDALYDYLLRGLAERVGNVHMLGYVPDVWPYYNGASVYASCSLYEGEDRPALEAQSMGVPVVAYDNYSHPEVVKHGYCATGDVDFVDALCYYLSHDCRDMDAARFVRREYNLGAVVERYNRLIKDVV